MTNLDSILKSRDITLPTKVHLVKAMVFPVVMYGCESWTIKKPEHWRIDAFELWCWRGLLRVCKESKPVNPKGNQSWIFTGRTEVEAETPIFWPPDGKELTHWKRPWCWERLKAEEKGTTEDEMVGWHHWLDGHGFGWPLGVGDGQGGLACCSSWGHKESDTAERPNWTELIGLISLKSKGLPRVFPNTTIQKHEFFSAQLSLWSNSHIHTWPLEKP